jgi:hypothetical protein
MKEKVIYRTVAAIHAGNPAPDYQDWARTNICFHGVEDITVTDDVESKSVESPQFSCLGHQWVLKFTRFIGDLDCFYLHHRSSGTIHIEYRIEIKHFTRPDILGGGGDNEGITRYEFEGLSECRSQRILMHQDVVEYITNGGLMLEVRMMPVGFTACAFVPENPSACETIQDLLLDDESADLVFEVGGDQSTPTKFYAHSVILRNASPLLVGLCKPIDQSHQSPCVVQIADVSPVTFDYMLWHLYGCENSDFGHDVAITKDIIEATNKYGLTNLKLKAEASYVSSTTISLDNFMEHLHFANSKSCYLLQEAVMDFIVKNKIEILGKNLFTEAPEGLICDILAAVARGEERGNVEGENIFSVMSISDLRRRAYDKGLDVDGSRDMLISALNNA